jgi:hypothetical protein
MTKQLEAARLALRALSNEDAEVSAGLERLRQQAAPATRDVGASAALHQQRRSIFNRMLRLGRPAAEAEGELAVIDDQVADARLRDERAQAAAEVMRELEAEATEKRADIARRAAAAQQRLNAQAVLAAEAEFESEAIPALIEAMETFRQAVGRVYGSALARDQLRKKANDWPSWMDPMPALRGLSIQLPAIGIEERLRGRHGLQVSNFSVIDINAGDVVERVASEVVARLSDRTPATPAEVAPAAQQASGARAVRSLR